MTRDVNLSRKGKCDVQIQIHNAFIILRCDKRIYIYLKPGGAEAMCSKLNDYNFSKESEV